jgi:hypothetical protein
MPASSRTGSKKRANLIFRLSACLDGCEVIHVWRMSFLEKKAELGIIDGLNIGFIYFSN